MTRVWDPVDNTVFWVSQASTLSRHVHSANANPSQPIVTDVPRYPSLASESCMPGYNTTAFGPTVSRYSTADGSWAGTQQLGSVIEKS